MANQTQQIIKNYLSLSELITAFLLERKSRGLQQLSIEFYRAHLKQFTAWAGPQQIKQLDQITPALIRAYMIHLEETEHRPGYIHGFYRTIRAFLKWYALEFEPDNWQNPIRKVKAPKVPTEPLDPISLDDIRAMIATCKGGSFTAERDKAIILTLLDSGVRASELLSINGDDCNFITGDILIRKGKNSKPRTVFVGKVTRRALRAFMKLRQDDSPALFVTDEGGRLTYDGLRAIMTRRAKLAGIAPPALHGFRRAFTINMLRMGVDPVSISRLLGHGDLQMILKYAKQNADDLRDVHARASPGDGL
jgi:site-specific recombinase XerD